MEKLAANFFDDAVTPKDHAIFELGIKLGAIFHLMMGFPVKNDPQIIESICNGVQSSISCQPFVQRVEIGLKSIQGEEILEYTKRHEFDYTSVNGMNLVAEVEILYEKWLAVGRVEWVPDLRYPLMYIVKIKEIDGS